MLHSCHLGVAPLAGTSNIRSEGIMKVGKGQSVEAYFNQKIRAEETGYHLQVRS